MPQIAEILLAALVICANVAPIAILAPVEQPNGVRRAASLLEKKQLDGRPLQEPGKIDKPKSSARPNRIS